MHAKRAARAALARSKQRLSHEYPQLQRPQIIDKTAPAADTASVGFATH